ncbi:MULTISPECIES: hypothetical protein [unclassified Paenibacillus]|uniref:hypothetical protein n=1 Tax=unclassified Paenibacillus TaxID=185978 RepID=UPI000838CD24|nr:MULTISPECIES: hypothetical protein [unclassified Paenibacillus]NWL87166.1 hypothetical protein [Paenibacillus sp. 79R4]
MVWIGLAFVLIMLFDGHNQHKLKMSRRKKLTSQAVTMILLILIEIQYVFREKYNLLLFIEFIANHIFTGSAGK